MIYLYQGQNNQVAAVCSRNKTLTGNVQYLWSIQHKLSGRKFRFIPFRVPPSVPYSPGYDLFCIDIDASIPNVLTGATSCGETNVGTLIPGEYYVKIYEQMSTSNLDPMLAHDVVQETLLHVVGINQNIPTTYTGGTDGVFIIYNDNNN
jgi:hypothetical protein